MIRSYVPTTIQATAYTKGPLKFCYRILSAERKESGPSDKRSGRCVFENRSLIDSSINQMVRGSIPDQLTAETKVEQMAHGYAVSCGQSRIEKRTMDIRFQNPGRYRKNMYEYGTCQFPYLVKYLPRWKMFSSDK